MNAVGDLNSVNLESIGFGCNRWLLMNWIGTRVENRSGCQKRMNLWNLNRHQGDIYDVDVSEHR